MHDASDGIHWQNSCRSEGVLHQCLQLDGRAAKPAHGVGEELQHRYAIKETRSKLKGTIGSRLMNERKKEKRVLELEHEHIMQVTQPELLIG